MKTPAHHCTVCCEQCRNDTHPEEGPRTTAAEAQDLAALYFREPWLMFICETLPWGTFDRLRAMRVMQEKTAVLYAKARRLAETDE
jgi:hypothetical protein